ncbi:MAG: hypothetical protein GY953_02285, partial [bacterium]|nr:hypothetical protein [bacterium]
GETIVNNGEFTFEVWAKAGNNLQTGPATLLNYSKNLTHRNFALGPHGADMHVSVRTTAGDPYGSPTVVQPAVVTTEVQHWVVTFGGGVLRLFENGVPIREEARAGALGNWDLSQVLFIGAETYGRRFWQGEIYLAAVYGRALTEAEVLRNYLAGDNPGAGGPPIPINQAPQVTCDNNHTVVLPANSVHIEGTVDDDGLPSGHLTYNWSKVSGPGPVAFDPSDGPATTASFSQTGAYVLRLTASDGALEGSGEVSVLMADAVSSARVSRDLVVFYPFDEGDGSVARDQSGRGSPLDLTLEGDAGWLGGRHGVVLGKGAKLQSAAAAKLHQALTASNAFTIEVWAKPADLRQWGPARLVSNSWDAHKRNFTLGQQSARAEVRLRTTGGNEDGWPYLRQEDAVSDGVEHYAMTLAGGVLSLYRNGQLVKSEPREGDLSNWDPSYPLLVGNERTGDRSWRGEFYLLAIYDLAL